MFLFLGLEGDKQVYFVDLAIRNRRSDLLEQLVTRQSLELHNFLVFFHSIVSIKQFIIEIAI